MEEVLKSMVLVEEVPKSIVLVEEVPKSNFRLIDYRRSISIKLLKFATYASPPLKINSTKFESEIQKFVMCRIV